MNAAIILDVLEQVHLAGDPPANGVPGPRVVPRDGRDEGVARERTILIVDDNLDLAENLHEILSYEGFGCTLARDGETAIELIAGSRFDLVVTDLRMGERSGLDVIRAARDRWPDMPVVLMTAFIRDEQVIDAESSGVRKVIPKPFPMSALVELVRDET